MNTYSQTTANTSTQFGSDETSTFFNENDVRYAISKLAFYNDSYSRGVVSTFINYLEHKEWKRMREELEMVPHPDKANYSLWDINANIGFYEVIYPA